LEDSQLAFFKYAPRMLKWSLMDKVAPTVSSFRAMLCYVWFSCGLFTKTTMDYNSSFKLFIINEEWSFGGF